MPRQPWPEWMKPALDGRFNDLARIFSKLDEIEPLHRKQAELEHQLKQELTMRFRLILEWEETLNYRNA